ncbi:MAG: aldehyde dehydrogenase family protein, partial [Candidatus Methylomirabilales bacterium]
ATPEDVNRAIEAASEAFRDGRWSRIPPGERARVLLKAADLIEERLKELGFDPSGYDPLAAGYGPLFQYLTTLETTVERAAAGQFTREAIALVKNQQFIDLCETKGDPATAKLYRETIQVDEGYHHELGRKILLKYATTPELQEKARAAAMRTLELAEELQHLMLAKKGIHHAPGC